MKKPIIYALVPPNANATTYYRVTLPIVTMHDLGRAEAAIDNNDPRVTQKEREFIATTSDVIAWRANHSHGLSLALHAYRSKPWYKLNGEWKLRPLSIMDFDDDMWRVQPFNGAFQSLGICVESNGQLRMLAPGDVISQEDEGEVSVMWADGENGFDIGQNISRLRNMAVNASAADLVTVSTPKLAKAILREVPGVEPFLLPNCVNLKHYHLDGALASHPDEIRILWQGSPTHLECWEELLPAVRAIAEKYPQTTWWFWGGEWRLPIWRRIADGLPQDRVKLISWCPYEEYKVRLATMGHDINLAPLYKSEFNDSRSAIKMYESAALNTPVPTLAANWGAYSEEMVDGDTGLLYDTPEEFGQKLEALILDADLRKRLASNAQAWIMKHRNPEVWATKLADKLDEIREARMLTPKPEEPNVPENDPIVRGSEAEGLPPS